MPLDSDFKDVAAADVTSNVYSREQVYELCKKDLNFFASIAIPVVFTVLFPALHCLIWDFLLDSIVVSSKPSPSPTEKFPQIAIGWPRGHAKTTLVKLFVLYCILFTQKSFILIVASNLPKAQNILADIMDMLSEENIVQLFGRWNISVETDQKDLKKFTFQGREIVIAALGSGGDPRGLNIKNKRPDVIVMDDMQSKENADSPTQSKTLLGWMTSTLAKAKSPTGCLFIYIGNMFSSPTCILKILKTNPNWKSTIVAGILADGEALWPELRTKEELLQELKEDIAMGTPEAFFAEIMNDDTAGITSCFDITKVPECPFPETEEIPASFIVIDVAGETIGADDTSIMRYAVFDGSVVCEEMQVGIFSPSDTIKKALSMCITHNVPLICVEAVAYQASLLHWFGIVCTELGIEGIHFEKVTPKGRSKNSRIITMFKSLLGSQIDGRTPVPSLYLRNKVRPQIFWQIVQFKPDKTKNRDDILDNLAYAEDVMRDYGPLTWNRFSIASQAFEQASVQEYNSPF